MPTLVRLLTVLAILGALVFAVMAALVAFVEPRRGEISFEVPVEALQEPAPVRRMPERAP
ncbi:histidine kinase [Aureimonas populi]|uniref:Histidine kinase n=1 Tax=Aureimonas populi TaxID=1701758 RepID=A0ABW5CKV1_9HYPH|nr:histidine kinase [Aureimonas populi]